MSFYHWNPVSDRLKSQPEFNKWSQYHRARKYARILARMKRFDMPQEISKGRNIGEITALQDYYINLCWDRDSYTKRLWAEDAPENIKVYRNNRRYKEWAKKFKFKVGMVIDITENHGYSAVKEFGVGEQVRVIAIMGSGNGHGFPRIQVERVRDGKRPTRLDGKVSEYDAAHFVVRPMGMQWMQTAQERRDYEYEVEADCYNYL